MRTDRRLVGVVSLKGRAGRGTFWITTLCVGGIGAFVAAALIATVIFHFRSGTMRSAMDLAAVGVAILLALVYVGIAVQVRRWHDLGYSGWMVLINFVPLVGGMVSSVVLGFIEGASAPNRFDEDRSLSPPGVPGTRQYSDWGVNPAGGTLPISAR